MPMKNAPIVGRKVAGTSIKLSKGNVLVMALLMLNKIENVNNVKTLFQDVENVSKQIILDNNQKFMLDMMPP